MILTCPNCGTQYVVKDGAIPPEGRQVRCAACKHSWHQEPEDEGEPRLSEAALEAAPSPEIEEAPPEAIEPDGRDGDDESFTEAAMIEPRGGPELEERAYEESVINGEAAAPTGPETGPEPAEVAAPSETSSEEAAVAPLPEEAAASPDWNEPPMAEPAPDMFSPFAADGEVEPRRRSPLVAAVIVVLIIVAAAALFWFVAPASLKAKLGVASAGATPLQLVTTHMDRTPLESGNELLTVTGRVINPSGNKQDVPPINAQLKDRSGKVVYSWTIQPPAQSLAAGASAPFNSAEVNVPPGGDELTITLGEPRA